MKKIFAAFCALVLMPSFSAQAWVGGPYSANSFSDVGGDDGVYEVVATARNGLGLYRIVVGNNFDGVNPAGVQSSVPSQVPNTGNNNPLIVPGLNSGNIFFGGLGSNASNIWVFEGVSYFGNVIGTVNSAQGRAFGVGTAFTGANQTGARLSSFFRANMTGTGPLLPVRSFAGTGRLEVSTQVGRVVRFSVFGSKVSDEILFGL
ncbi:MAG: hypothetical protein JNJ70_09610 [Verrucomicrobiales bacterium]|nr:hypothetical protein [Verrucomicrobiales bacterium]